MIKMEIYEKVKDDSSLLPILSLPVYIKENRLSPILCRRLEDYYLPSPSLEDILAADTAARRAVFNSI